MKIGWIAFVLALCLAAGGIVPAAAQAPAQPLIERVVVSYADSGTIDEQALAELTALDPELGKKWTLIMHLWEAPVDVCPRLSDDLPGDDSLCLGWFDRALYERAHRAYGWLVPILDGARAGESAHD